METQVTLSSIHSLGIQSILKSNNVDSNAQFYETGSKEISTTYSLIRFDVFKRS